MKGTPPNSCGSTKSAELSRLSKTFSRLATSIAHATGKPLTFIIAIATILIWAIAGPIFGFSDTWQLVINTGTTIVTFLMVFLIQNTQNRDGAAIQAKLDELVRTSSAANRYVGIEELTEEELDELRKTCRIRVSEASTRAQKRANEAVEKCDNLR